VVLSLSLVDSLIQLPDSPLDPATRQLLADAIAGSAISANETISLKLLGIKRV